MSRTPELRDTPALDAERFADGFRRLMRDLEPADGGQTGADGPAFSIDTVRALGRELFDAQAAAFELRFMALLPMLQPAMDEGWLVGEGDDPDEIDVHPAVLAVAAGMKLNRNGKFPLRLFLDRVAEQAARGG